MTPMRTLTTVRRARGGSDPFAAGAGGASAGVHDRDQGPRRPGADRLVAVGHVRRDEDHVAGSSAQALGRVGEVDDEVALRDVERLLVVAPLGLAVAVLG